MVCIAMLLSCLASVSAQSASGVSGVIVYKHPRPFVEASVDSTTDSTTDSITDAVADSIAPPPPAPALGVAPPDTVEKLLMQEVYGSALALFDAFFDTVQGDLCHILYARLIFYGTLAIRDEENVALYVSKRDACLAEMEKHCPRFADMYLMKAMLCSHPKKALKWIDKAIRLAPDNGSYYSTRGDIFWAINKEEKACADYRKAIDLGDAYGASQSGERCTER